MQRLRMALPYFAENGWETTVVTLDPRDYTAPTDEALTRTVPSEARVIKLRGWDEQTCRRFGFGHISNRIVWPWRRGVREILKREAYDLVFFTTTQFMVMLNGPHWRRSSCVPYVIDLQDPIYVPGGSYTRANAPGSYWKYKCSNLLARHVEKTVFAMPSAVVATSAHYLEVLRERYAHLAAVPMRALPFGLPEMDLQIADTLASQTPVFKRRPGSRVILYAGRGGPDLHPALEALFRSSATLARRDPTSRERLQMVFVGTSYGPAGAGIRQVAPIAESCGVASSVVDEPERRPYFDVLKATGEADCSLVLGSKSADYTASKALVSLAAARRVLAIVNEESLVHRLYAGHSKVLLCSFKESPLEENCLRSIEQALAKLVADYAPISVSSAVSEEYTARGMTKQLCEMFEAALKQP